MEPPFWPTHTTLLVEPGFLLNGQFLKSQLQTLKTKSDKRGELLGSLSIGQHILIGQARVPPNWTPQNSSNRLVCD